MYIFTMFFSDGSRHYDAGLILNVNYEVTY